MASTKLIYACGCYLIIVDIILKDYKLIYTAKMKYYVHNLEYHDMCGEISFKWM